MPLQEARRSPHALPRTATAACLSLCRQLRLLRQLRQLRLLRQFRLLRQLRLLGLLLLPPTPPAPPAPPAPCMQNVGFGGSGCGFGRAWRRGGLGPLVGSLVGSLVGAWWSTSWWSSSTSAPEGSKKNLSERKWAKNLVRKRYGRDTKQTKARLVLPTCL